MKSKFKIIILLLAYIYVGAPIDYDAEISQTQKEIKRLEKIRDRVQECYDFYDNPETNYLRYCYNDPLKELRDPIEDIYSARRALNDLTDEIREQQDILESLKYDQREYYSKLRREAEAEEWSRQYDEERRQSRMEQIEQKYTQNPADTCDGELRGA